MVTNQIEKGLLIVNGMLEEMYWPAISVLFMILVIAFLGWVVSHAKK